MNRRGFTIIEMIITTATITVLLLILTKPMHLFWRDIMAKNKDFQAYKSQTHWIERLRRDFQQADSFDLTTAADSVILCLIAADKTVEYRIKGSEAKRYITSQQSPADEWKIPNIVWHIECWPNNQTREAIIMRTSINRYVQGDTIKQFENSVMLFPLHRSAIKP